MDTWVWIVIAVFVAIVVLGIVVSALRTRRTVLQDSSAPSTTARSTRPAAVGRPNASSRERQKRHDELDIKPLSPECARPLPASSGTSTQARFVDDPNGCGVGSGRPRPAGDAGPRLPGRRLRAARRRHLGRASRPRREVPHGARRSRVRASAARRRRRICATRVRPLPCARSSEFLETDDGSRTSTNVRTAATSETRASDRPKSQRFAKRSQRLADPRSNRSSAPCSARGRNPRPERCARSAAHICSSGVQWSAVPLRASSRRP